MRLDPGLARCALLLLLSLAAAPGCASNPASPRDGGDGMDGGTTPRPDGGGTPSDRCGAAGGACCAGRICELGLRCGSGDVCCIQPGGGARCDSASDCCRGLACQGGACCAPRTAACSGSSDCCMGLACVDGACVSPEEDLPPGSEDCGIAGRTCCPGFTCRSGLVCTDGTCGACGDEGQACCDGATACVGSLACDVTTGTCVNADPSSACGEIDNACCPDSTGTPSECSGDLVCRGGTCLRPDDTGFMGAPCGPRGSCDPGLVCDRRMDPSGLCEMTPEDCGRDGQMCCDLGGSERTCQGSLHCQFGDCSTCRGPSLTCLLGGLLPGQQCCAGSVCRPAPLVPRCCMGEGGRCENSLDCCGLMSCGGDGTCSCSREGSFCLDSSECCEGLTCQTFMCRPMGPMCKESGSECSSSGECCAGLACSEVRPDRTAPASRQCCAGAGTSCSSREDCCGQMACTNGECECVRRNGACERDIECCDGDICVAGNCVDGTGCARERESCETTPCCGIDLRCLADSTEAPRECCVGPGQRCFSNEDCCGMMECGSDQTCQCRQPANPETGTAAQSCVHTVECCGASFCSGGVCSFT